jgi:hypothetical protein
MTDRLLLLLLTAGCLIFGAIIFTEIEPAETGQVAISKAATQPDTGAPIRRQQNPRIDEVVATALARPLFSSTRRPPQSASLEASTDTDLADTRLTGIVTDPDHRIAIFVVTGGDKPLRLAEGESISGWRIESITAREVSLNGPNGAKTLQPKFDPNLVPPPAQPSTGNAGGRVPTPAAIAAAARLPVPPAAANVGQPRPAAPINLPATPPRPPRLRQQR